MSKHSKTSFRDQWEEKEEYKGWIKKDPKDQFSALCLACGWKKSGVCSFSIASAGMKNVDSHAKGTKHLNNLDEYRNFKKSNLSFSISGNLQSSTTTEKNFENQFGLANQQMTLRAELIMLLEQVRLNQSLATHDGKGQLFRDMFPDSQIVAEYASGSSKASYLLNHGIHPYYKNRLIEKFKHMNEFGLLFDETTTSQCKKQLDLYARCWIHETGVCTFYLDSVFLGHASAEITTRKLVVKLEEFRILDKIRHLSMDGPNVNKTIFKLLNEKISGKLIDIDTCNMHKVHTGFRSLLCSLSVDLDEVFQDFYGFFSKSPARRADLVDACKGSDQAPRVMTKHCPTRWLSLARSAEDLKSQLLNYKKYFLEFIPTTVDFKKSVKNTSRYKRISHHFKPSNLIILQINLEFAIFVAKDMEQFLKIFQTKKPLIHILHRELRQLVKNVLVMFMKPTCIDEIVDVKSPKKDKEKAMILDVNNHLKLSECDFGTSTRMLLLEYAKTKSALEVTKQRHYLKDSLTTMVLYFIAKLPLSNKILKNASILSSKNIHSDNSLTKVSQLAVGTFLGADEIDSLRREWKLLRADEDIPQIEEVSAFWCQVFQLKNSMDGLSRYKVLPKFVIPCLLMSHGNADPERGFSTNKLLVTKQKCSLSEETIVATRFIKDQISHANHVTELITRDVIKFCLLSYSRYAQFMADKKKKEAESDKEIAKAAAEEERNRLKRKLNDEVDEVTKQIKEATKHKDAADDVIKMGQNMLTEACTQGEDSRAQRASVLAAKTILDKGLKQKNDLHEKIAKLEAKKHQLIVKKTKRSKVGDK